MPNFVRKWNDKIDFVGDATLDRGIEIKPKTYTKSLSESIEMINDFYSDLEKQSYWKFTEKTGLHINIGSNNKVEWNPIKGLMLLNDFNKEDKTPFMFKDMTWRMNNMFCGSLIPYIKLMSDKEKIKIIAQINIKLFERKRALLQEIILLKSAFSIIDQMFHKEIKNAEKILRKNIRKTN